MNPTRRVFLKELGVGAAALGFLMARPDFALAAKAGAKRLSRSTPEAQGVSSAGLLAFLEAVGQSRHEFHSFMMLRHGQVIAEGWWSPYGPKLNHMLYSLSKSFTSTAVGMAAAEGKLKVGDPVISFFSDEVPPNVSEHLAALRVKDLLSMSVGQPQDSLGAMFKEENWVKTFLALPIQYAPGTRFLYNSGATYMLSAIVQKVTGQRLIDFLTPRLFKPLGIEGMTWESCPRGINVGGWGLNIQTEGLAKFGQLYLQKGLWEGCPLLPAQWVEEATTAKINQPSSTEADRQKSDWHQGYGYQFWRCRHNAFRGDGAFGQYTIVMPEQDAVIAITSETPSMQGQLDLIWEHLLPAMKDRPLPRDKSLQRQLEDKLGNLALLPPKGRPQSPWASRVSRQSYTVEPNDLGVQGVSFAFTGKRCVVTFQAKDQAYPISCGIEKWVHGETDLPGTPPKLTSGGKVENQTVSKIAASGTWQSEQTFAMQWRYYETPHHDDVSCQFEGDTVQVTFRNSMAKMSPNGTDKRPVLKGKRGQA